MQQEGVPEDSPLGQMLLKDPKGTTENMLNSIAMMRSRTAKQLGAESTEKIKGELDLKKQESANAAHLANARITAQAQGVTAEKNLRGQMIQYSGQLRQELDGLNNNITKLEGKELDNAIMQDFMNRGKKDVTQADVDKAKGELKASLIARRDSIQTELDSVSTEVRGKLGMKQPGTKEQPIVLTPTTQ